MALIQIQQPNNLQQPQKPKGHPFWELAFRPWFLLASVWSVLAITIWMGFLHGKPLTHQWHMLNPLVWHTHEMIFGFAATVAAGFVLTAVQTWTNQPSINGKPLMLLTAIWLIARVCFALNETSSIYLGFALQMLWWLGVIYSYSKLVLKANNKRNYIFIGLFSLMMIANATLLLADLQQNIPMAIHLAQTSVLIFALLISLIGGRVIGFFTKNGAPHSNPQQYPMLNLASNLLTAICAIGLFLTYFSQTHIIWYMLSGLFIGTGILQTIRLIGWQPHKTLKVPLLWSLHATYLAMSLGLILMGISFVRESITFSDALHLITVGSIGGMILAMIARVSLGHTGRMIIVGHTMAIAFSALIIAGLSRSLLAVFGMPQLSWKISAALWIIGFMIFVVVYTPILLAPRKDRIGC
ncbi:NnrS family protein [Catenovulum agarivorans DS-2]|uniref:NnrS family protein n=1 Tax=Catenovulum agarivorans DS-2 TaxID=1328313 RepID=W7QND0_9ALTE|nr:NnrS family protein [Catenovulum agarivorans]EWH09418.1 NnrS family protein [Catenovulum agarivorans DS-2]